tara:strand:+ start:4574 stop:7408 length:2835 start_codon:yes stop_codon:yes gene_type:complete
MTRKPVIRSIFVLILVFTLLSTLVYAVTTTLQSPVADFVDDDGFLDLRASCEASYDGTTSYNITKADLYSNEEGSWISGGTLQVENPIANATYYFNFTNTLSQVSESEFVWSVQCHEANSSNDGLDVNQEFAGNKTIKVEYAKPTVAIISPADGSHDLDGQDVLISCLATPSSGWNITQINLMTNMSSDWKSNQTFTILNRIVDTQFANVFNLNAGTNRSGDATNIVFGCSAIQIKNDLEGAPISESSSLNRTLNLGNLQQCVQGTCDIGTKQWCDNGVFVSDGYCDNCGGLDFTCTSCVGNSCDVTNQRWCEDNLWKGGTYSQYCSHCGYTDGNCPVCEGGVCDTTHKQWCNTNSTWSVIDYCGSCGSVDASCDATCVHGVCDTENRKVCNAGVWDESNYCFSCGSQDSSCSFECTNNACDTRNKRWCDNGAWSDADYCTHCDTKDFTCGATCLNNACDTTSNRWCDSGSWSFLNYCGHCEDSECLDICVDNSCDVNAKKWCDNGSWSDIDYCDNCGNKDSSCLSTCQEDTCDTTANKRCSSGEWITTNYCDYCALEDSDCTIGCAEGECDSVNKKVCVSGSWSSDSYDSLCVVQAINVSETICNEHGNCTIGTSCINNSECASSVCSDNLCSGLICSNGVKDLNETDIDCGGECGKCEDGKECSINLDCSSNLCTSGTCASIDLCNDRILNGDETGIDCGGTCENRCQLGRTCSIDGDCESSLTCTSGTCTNPIPDIGETIGGEDSDEDGIPDEWELDNGLDSSDPSDAYADFDNDGLTNIQEYTFGTNPNRADSDKDAVSDKDEIITEDTDPLDPVSKPGGVGGLLFFIIILIIVFGAGSYAFYYYKDKFIKPKARGPVGPTFMEQPLPQRQITRKLLTKKNNMQEIVKKRREQKEEKRLKLLETFSGKSKTSVQSKKQKAPGKKPQSEVFLKLEELSKKK